MTTESLNQVRPVDSGKIVTVHVREYDRDVELWRDEYTCRNCGSKVYYDRYPGSIKPTHCDRPACQKAKADDRRKATAERVARYRARKAGKGDEPKKPGNPNLKRESKPEPPRPRPGRPSDSSPAASGPVASAAENGARGVSLTAPLNDVLIAQLTDLFRAQHGYDWRLVGATIRRVQGSRDVQFVAPDGSTIAQAKNKATARAWLADYLANGKPNMAMLRH